MPTLIFLSTLIGNNHFYHAGITSSLHHSFIFSLFPGLCLGLEVHQSASDIIVQPGDKVEIFCSHSKTNYRVLLWYQRSPRDTAMKLIGNLYFKAVKMEKPYENNFNITGDLGGDKEKNGSLSFKAAARELSAIYYCAASEAR